MILSETRKQVAPIGITMCEAQRRGWRACPSQSIAAKAIENRFCSSTQQLQTG